MDDNSFNIADPDFRAGEIAVHRRCAAGAEIPKGPLMGIKDLPIIVLSVPVALVIWKM